MYCPDELLVLLGQISAEVLRGLRAHPNASVCDFDVLEDVCRRELVYLTLGRLVFVGSQGTYVDQPRHAVIRTSGSDNRARIRVADKNHGTVHPAHRTMDGGDVTLK